jgi:hypothetical protein
MYMADLSMLVACMFYELMLTVPLVPYLALLFPQARYLPPATCFALTSLPCLVGFQWVKSSDRIRRIFSVVADEAVSNSIS